VVRKKGALIDRAVFRPSNFPRLELCIHCEPKVDDKKEDKPAAGRGNSLHDLASAVMVGEIEIEQIEDRESRECVRWGIEEINRRQIQVEYVEYEVEIRNGDEVVTSGTCDGFGYSPDDLWVVDFKSGDERDYSGQFTPYSKSIMEEQKKTRCLFLVLYFDLRLALEYEITLEEATTRLAELVDRYVHRDQEEPEANEYCGWCAKRGECPVWLEPAGKALALAGGNPELVQRIEEIKKDPQRCADLYVAYKKLGDLMTKEWHISDALLEHLKNGAKPEGVVIAHKVGNSYVDPEKAMIACYKHLGAARMAQVVSINPNKLKEIWEGFTVDPFPLEIEVGPDIYFPKRTQPKGRGKARALRDKRAKEEAA
jgi:hypothetical protein